MIIRLFGKVGDTVIITITVNNSDNTYQVTLSGPIPDHPDKTLEDVPSFDVGVVANDGIVDSDSFALTIKVEDDSPMICS